MPAPVREYELFFDESGDFQEAGQGVAAGGRGAPSQLVGLLARKGVLTRERAEQVLQEAARQAGVAYDGYLHATELRGEDVQGLLAGVLPRIQTRDWQPVRITNKEGLDFGDKRATYTNMVAEFALRCLRQLARGVHAEILLHLCPAGAKDPDLNRHYVPDEYLRAVKEAMVRASIRAGLAVEQQRWRVGERLRFLSGRSAPEIFICDLLSNSSYANFRRLSGNGAGLKEQLQSQFGEFDFTLALRSDVEQIEGYCDASSFGMAAAVLLDRFVGSDDGSAPMGPLRALLPKVNRGLAGLGAPLRDLQFRFLLGHIEQTVHARRDPAAGSRMCEWVRKEIVDQVASHLGDHSSAELASVRYELALHMLIAANHGHDLLGAREALVALKGLQAGIVRRFEQINLFLQAQVNEAVHRTDCLQFGAAMEQAERVARFHEEIGSLLHDALPEDLPGQVRSTRRGQALGTAMQAAMYASAQAQEFRQRAERLGDQALQEFDNDADRSRQFQYRCQLATIGGDLAGARRWLAKALDLEDDAPSRVVDAIVARPDNLQKQFLTLHWVRLVAAAHRTVPRGHDADNLHEVTRAAKIADMSFIADGVRGHPATSVVRYLGEIASMRGDMALAMGMLRRLATAMEPQGLAMALLPMLALQARVASDALAAGDGLRAEQALAGDDHVRGLGTVLRQLRARLNAFPEWSQVLERWERAAVAAARGPVREADRRTLENLGTEIPY